jgi:O-6-methylguanine DNA methyltransferase
MQLRALKQDFRSARRFLQGGASVVQSKKQVRRAALDGRALEVILAPDGRISRIIIAEGLALRVDEMRQGGEQFSNTYFSNNANFIVPSPLAAEALQAFFSGADLTSIYKLCVYGDISPWQNRVMQAMALIERGKVLSYGGLAKRLGVPRAARAVGTACAQNPLPLLYPCHRVVQADGRIGNFMSQAGGTLKRRLLEHEGVRFGADGRVLAECFTY